ncbi:MAG: C40 family peptidase [Paludibacteraceae bacterium]|nr:C40 family peptidase [Paludibacteraceae bacterium]
MYGIVLHSIVPVRSEAKEQAEQTTQLLFAETLEVLQAEERWLRIRNDYDGQEGWVDRKMISLIDNEAKQQAFAEFIKSTRTHRVCMPMALAVSEANQQTLPLTGGTVLPNYKNGKFSVLEATFFIDPQMVATEQELTQEHLLQAVRYYLNIPYLWGGKNAFGMDCSGFTQVLMSLFGKRLKRNASEQAEQGTTIPSLSESRSGDLAFFDHHLKDKINHVGILIDKQTVVHCSGRVKIEKLNSDGIINTESGQLSHRLVKIVNI